jgi:apolipoprotein N-acyltransferase
MLQGNPYLWEPSERRKRQKERRKLAEAPTWRWVVFVAFFILFPIVFHPWWVALLSVVVFGLLAWLLFPGKRDSN